MADHGCATGLAVPPAGNALSLALRTAESVQQSIRHADSKAFGLAGVLGGLATVAVDRVVSLSASAGPVAGAACLLTVLFIVSCGTAAWHLARSCMPRLGVAPTPNRFAFPTVARAGGTPGDDGAQVGEAWDLVAVLSRIAVAKYRHLRIVLPALLVVAAGTAGLIGLDIMSDSFT